MLGFDDGIDWKRTGKLLRKAREERGMTQLDVALGYGIAQTTLSHWERGTF